MAREFDWTVALDASGFGHSLVGVERIRNMMEALGVTGLPPPDMPVDPKKWRNLDRKTRRALLRHHRKVVGK